MNKDINKITFNEIMNFSIWDKLVFIASQKKILGEEEFNKKYKRMVYFYNNFNLKNYHNLMRKNERVLSNTDTVIVGLPEDKNVWYYNYSGKCEKCNTRCCYKCMHKCYNCNYELKLKNVERNIIKHKKSKILNKKIDKNHKNHSDVESWSYKYITFCANKNCNTPNCDKCAIICFLCGNQFCENHAMIYDTNNSYINICSTCLSSNTQKKK